MLINPLSIQLVAVDLDGTVLKHDLTFTDRVRRGIQYVMARANTKVVIATGRMLYSAMPFAKMLGVRSPLVTYQGAMVLLPENAPPDWERPDENAPALVPDYHLPVPQDVAYGMAEELIGMGYSLNVYLHPKLYIQAVNPDDAEWYRQTSGIVPNLVDNLLDVMQASAIAPTKMAITAREPERAERLKAYLEAQSDKHPIMWCQSRSFFFEVTHREVSKWTALQFVCKQLGIPETATMTIGDHGNDLEMIQNAGFGVAMGNAIDEAKAVAKFVTTTVEEDGVVHALEHVGLLPPGWESEAVA